MTLSEERERLLRRLKRLDDAKAASGLAGAFRRYDFINLPYQLSIDKSSDYYPALCAFIDEIERVAEEVACETCDVPEEDKWISVDDERKPESYDSVLLARKSGQLLLGYSDGHGRFRPDDVTHWRPLPKAPCDVD